MRFLTRINNLFAEICGWLLIVIMGLMVLDLVARGVSRPVYGVSEMAMFVMIAVVYLGLGHAEEVRGHIRVELLETLLPRRAALVLDVAVYVLAVATITIVIYAVALNAWSSYTRDAAVAGPVPLLIWPVKFAMVAALGLYLLQLLVNLGLAVARLRDPERDAT
jgi:TRAP-type C4-dicarboxylate transport system permease small subunit